MAGRSANDGAPRAVRLPAAGRPAVASGTDTARLRAGAPPRDASGDGVGPAHRARLALASGLEIEAGWATSGDRASGGAFAPAEAGPRGALFMVVEGAPGETAALLYQSVQRALDADRGTSTARLLRALRIGCRRLEAQALHRFELAGLGVSALLIEDGSAYITQLPPSQAYVAEPDGVRALPEEPMRGAARVGSVAGRRWEVEIDICRFALRPGMAIVLCSSALAAGLSPARVAAVVESGAAAAAVSLAQRGMRSGKATRCDSLVVRVGAPPPRPAAARPRLLSIESQRRPRRVLTRATDDGRNRHRGAPITAWGLATRRGGLGEMAALLVGSRDPLAVAPPARRPALRWLRLGAVAAVLMGLVWLGWQRVSAPAPVPAPAAAEAVPEQRAAWHERTLMESDGGFRSLAVAGGQPYVLDVNAGVRVVPAGGARATTGERLPGGDDRIASTPAGTVALAARDGEVLALDGDRTLRRIAGGPAGDVRAVALRGADLWRRPRAMAVYAGNLYVLDAGRDGAAGQIWRHTAGSAGGFDGEATAWLQAGGGSVVALESATGIAVDGAVWVSRADGAILKLSGGRVEPFEIRGVERPIAAAGAIYTERGFQSLYVLDAAERRLVRLSKEGQVMTEIADVFPVGEHPVGLWVSEAARRGLVLTNHRLVEVEF